MPSALDSFTPPEPSAHRHEVLAALASGLAALKPGHRVVVAVDGVDGAGKTVLGRELTAYLSPFREVVRASVDGFHRPRVQRYARGRSPETYYRDSYDYASLSALLVEPFRAGRPFVTAVFDVEVDAPVPQALRTAGPAALLLVDGIFLQRPELRGHWDAAVFVDVPFEVSVPRGNSRFSGTLDADPLSDANRRYVEGQRLYLDEARPAERATWVVDNCDLNRPVLRHGCNEGKLRH
jgi:uridine kinase